MSVTDPLVGPELLRERRQRADLVVARKDDGLGDGDRRGGPCHPPAPAPHPFPGEYQDGAADRHERRGVKSLDGAQGEGSASAGMRAANGSVSESLQTGRRFGIGPPSCLGSGPDRRRRGWSRTGRAVCQAVVTTG